MKDSDISSPSDLSALSINTNNGRMNLGNFVTIEEGRSPQKIQREDGDRVNHITASLVEGTAATDVQQVIEDILKEGFVQEDYNIIINYIRTYLEKLMDSPEDITLRNEVDVLKKEIAELKDKLSSITNEKA